MLSVILQLSAAALFTLILSVLFFTMARMQRAVVRPDLVEGIHARDHGGHRRRS